MTAACEAAGVPRQTAYDWRAADPDFAAEWADVVETVTDRLEAAALERATNGYEEIVGVTKGGDPITAHRFSDRLAEVLLRGRRREVYGDKREHTFKGFDPERLKAMTEEELRGLRDKLGAALSD